MVKFVNLGEITAHDAVRIVRERDNADVTTYPALDAEESYAVAVLHPEGGRIYIHHGVTASFAVLAASELHNVLSAWVEESARD